MKQEITFKIDVPDGKRVVYNEETRTLEFEDIDTGRGARIRSKSWDEFCKNHPNLENEYYLKVCEGEMYQVRQAKKGERHYTDTTYLETTSDVLAINSLMILKRLHDEWVSDWTPGESKWVISWVGFGDNPVCRHNTTGHHRFLEFPTEEMCLAFLECFKNFIIVAKEYI